MYSRVARTISSAERLLFCRGIIQRVWNPSKENTETKTANRKRVRRTWHGRTDLNPGSIGGLNNALTFGLVARKTSPVDYETTLIFLSIIMARSRAQNARLIRQDFHVASLSSYLTVYAIDIPVRQIRPSLMKK